MPSSLIAIGAAVSEWWAGTSLASIASFAARTLLTIGLTKLIANKAGDTGTGTTSNGGGRVQLAPSTDNMLPVVYGSAFVAPVLTDAKISSDNKTMWYVCALSEVTDTGTISFGNMYYDGKLVTFDGTDPTKVVSLTTNASPAQEDTSCSGSLYVYAYTNGSNNPSNTSLTAIQVLQDAGIPVDYRWTSTDLMSSTAFIIVKIIYNQNSGLTNLGQIQVQVNNSLNKPGDVVNDYLQNTRYGCAIPSSQVDAASIAALNAYSDVLIPYTPEGGGSATQARYRINGIINTGNNCMSNLQQLVDACDTWLQYSELTGKWKFVINQSYEQAGQTLSDLYIINSSNLVGGIDLQPLDLNGTYNQMEIQYPNHYVRDQTNFINLNLRDTPDYVVMSPNEPVNKLTVQLPQVNNYVQAYYLGVRRLLQSREDLTITCQLDFSGIQVEAGDVVRVTLEQYGWVDKLFRVSQVQESKDNTGNLGARITAFEYNSTLYSNDAIDDYIPSDNTGLTDPNILNSPGQPTVATSSLVAGAIASFVVTTTIPTSGQTLYLDFNFGTTNVVSSHKLYRTITPTSSQQFTPGSTVTVTVNDLPPGTYYWSTKARNNVQGRSSLSSSGYTWSGMNITPYTSTIISNASSSGNVVTVGSTANVVVGQNVTGGGLPSGVTVAAILGAGAFALSQIPGSPLANAVIKLFGGGVPKSSLPFTAPPTSLGSAIYAINQGDGSEILPVNVTTVSPGYNEPIYIIGSTVSPSKYTPWAQGTSSTSDGYISNSTGPFTPADASEKHLTNGQTGWYSFIQVPYDVGTISSGTQVISSLELTLISDIDTNIQIAPYSTISTDSLLHSSDDTTYSFPLLANQVFSTSTSAYHVLVGADSNGDGWIIRNMTSGANVVIMFASLTTSYSDL